VTLEPQRAEVDHPERDRVRVTVTTPATVVTHSLSLFKSSQEAAFFHALRTVFQMYTPYPNVALSSLIDFDAIRDRLSAEERDYFFKGIVDCVLFDPHDDYRPIHFFELDSSHHDDPDQQEKDAYKDRIIAAAGHRLYRVRPQVCPVTTDDFVATLRGVLGAPQVQPAYAAPTP
jgi:hypothetical protein